MRFLCRLLLLRGRRRQLQTELQAGSWDYSKEETTLTDKSTGAEFAAAGHTHLITAHPENGAQAWKRTNNDCFFWLVNRFLCLSRAGLLESHTF